MGVMDNNISNKCLYHATPHALLLDEIMSLNVKYWHSLLIYIGVIETDL
jgi:hypothetical protein